MALNGMWGVRLASFIFYLLPVPECRDGGAVKFHFSTFMCHILTQLAHDERGASGSIAPSKNRPTHGSSLHGGRNATISFTYH